MGVIGEWSLPALILTHKPFMAFFSLLCLAEEGSAGEALTVTWHPSRVKPPQTDTVIKSISHSQTSMHSANRPGPKHQSEAVSERLHYFKCRLNGSRPTTLLSHSVAHPSYSLSYSFWKCVRISYIWICKLRQKPVKIIFIHCTYSNQGASFQHSVYRPEKYLQSFYTAYPQGCHIHTCTSS